MLHTEQIIKGTLLCVDDTIGTFYKQRRVEIVFRRARFNSFRERDEIENSLRYPISPYGASTRYRFSSILIDIVINS